MKVSAHAHPAFALIKTKVACGVLVSAAALSACVGSAATGTPPAKPASNQTVANTKPTTASLMRDIAQEVGDAACDTNAQCHTLGVGAKACGGPEGYLAWSGKVNGNGTRLSELAAAHSTARRAENELSGMRSNCSITPDPGAVCQARANDGLRVCQTVQRVRSGGAV